MMHANLLFIKSIIIYFYEALKTKTIINKINKISFIALKQFALKKGPKILSKTVYQSAVF